MENFQFSGVRKTYVCFNFVRYLFDVPYIENEIREVKSRDLKKLKIPGYAFKFHFFDCIEGAVEVEREKLEFESDCFNHSKIHYYAERIYTREEIQKTNKRWKKNILENMDINQSARVFFYGWKSELCQFLSKDEDDYVFVQKSKKTKKAS